jgi:hypothetical protein
MKNDQTIKIKNHKFRAVNWGKSKNIYVGKSWHSRLYMMQPGKANLLFHQKYLQWSSLKEMTRSREFYGHTIRYI